MTEIAGLAAISLDQDGRQFENGGPDGIQAETDDKNGRTDGEQPREEQPRIPILVNVHFLPEERSDENVVMDQVDTENERRDRSDGKGGPAPVPIPFPGPDQ